MTAAMRASDIALILGLLPPVACACSPATPALRDVGMGALPLDSEVPDPAPPDDAGLPVAPDATAEGELDTAGPAPAEAECPDGMVLVEGDYCPEVDHTCLGYLDPPGRYHEYRCRAYGPPRCEAAREGMRFCIDAREYTPPGHSLPAHYVTFLDAKRICGDLGKRVCTESEWNFACEGEQMRPYPYGDKRDASVCNADHTDLKAADGGLRDRRAPSGSHEGCVSPFGVYDLAGNMEELVASDDDPEVPVMKGAWWLPGRNHCRARQTFHNDRYKGIETGFRCCADVDG